MEKAFPTFQKWGSTTRNSIKNNVVRLTAGMLAIYGVATVAWLWKFVLIELNLSNLGNLSYILYIPPIIIGTILWVTIGTYWIFNGALQLWGKKIVGVRIGVGGLLWMFIPGFFISSTYLKNPLYKAQPDGSLQVNYTTLIPLAWVVFNLLLYLLLAISRKKLPSSDDNQTTTITTKKFVIAGFLILTMVLGYSYYWSRNSPLFAYKNRSGQNKDCEKKCQVAARESFDKCGKDCWEGAPIYAFNRTTKICLMRSDLTGPDYFDFYVKDCNTNQYIKRWNVSKESTASTTWLQIQNQTIMKMQDHNAIVEQLIGKNGEIFLLGY